MLSQRDPDTLLYRAVPCCVMLAPWFPAQYGQSSFYKLPGGKLKPDEDGGWLVGVVGRGVGGGWVARAGGRAGGWAGGRAGGWAGGRAGEWVGRRAGGRVGGWMVGWVGEWLVLGWLLGEWWMVGWVSGWGGGGVARVGAGVGHGWVGAWWLLESPKWRRVALLGGHG